MSKFFQPKPKLTKDEINAMKFTGDHWREVDDPSIPTDGSKFPARISGTNRVKAVWWSDEFDSFCDGNCLVEITQWTTFKEMAEVTACMWREGTN